MSTPHAKRRRLDAASTLSKPFKSPFKTPLKAGATATASQDPPTNPEDSLTPSMPTNKPLHNISSSHRTTPTSASSPTTTRPPRPRTSHFSSPIATAKLNADPEISELLKKQRELERELREVKEELDVVEQARKIEAESEKKGGDVDGELMVLIGKWKGASRGAAEEMFGGVKDRVNRMGGPQAWKDMQKRQQEFQFKYDEDDTKKKPSESDDDSDEDDDEDEKMAKRQRREFRDKYGDVEDVEVETENEREQRGGNVVDEDEGEVDEFTMAMMLKTLNIDPKLIGYDKEAQRWVD